MKTTNTIIAVIIILVLYASCTPTRSLVSKSTLRNDYITVDKDEQLFCSKYEVTNRQYKLFLDHLKKTDLTEFNKCKVDTTKWYSETLTKHKNGPMVRAYSWHPVYNDYPVVNIPYYGANKYCEWLNSISSKDDIVFRLPHENEFNQLVESLEITILSDYASDYSCPNFNLNYVNDYDGDGAYMMVTANRDRKDKIVSLVQNNEGLMHVVGNVSEYLSDGQSAGGSWTSLPSEISNIDTKIEGSPSIGFRVWYQKMH
jgi:formylglycine-generating enzyme required for sulfatase activity